MPRNVTVTFGDGSSHVYNGVPDDVTPDAVISRAGKEFPSLQIKNIDGGKGAAPEMQPPMVMPYAEGDPELSIKDVGQAARGAAAEVLGTPGSIEQLVRRGTSALGITDPKSPTILPTPEDIEKKFGPVPPNGREAGYRQLGGATADIGMMVAPLLDAVEAAPAIGRGAAAVGRGLTPAWEAVKSIAEKTPLIGKAVGKESAAAKSAVVSDARAGIGELERDAQASQATKAALDRVTSGRPTATVLEVKKPATDTANQLTKARAEAARTQRELAQAKAKTIQASQKLSESSQFAGPKKSFAVERAAQRDLRVAKRDEANAAQAHAEAKAALDEAQSSHTASIKAGKKESTTEGKINKDAQGAQKSTTRMSIWANNLDNAKTAEDVGKVAKQISDEMFRAGKLTKEQHKQFGARIETMIETADSTKKARDRLVVLLKGAGIIGGVGIGSGVGYEIRRFIP